MLFCFAMAGLFITFEGLDGSGKSTHLKRAAAWLAGRGVPCLATHEPGGTPLGDAIRGIFLDPRWGPMDGVVELLLVFASRREHLLAVIEPALARGVHVLCDRFTDSTLAYQGYGRGVPRERIAQIDALATGGRRPDHTLLFDLPPELARERGHSPGRRRGRGGADRLDAEDLAFYGRVREGFLALAAAHPERFHRVDSSRGAAETFEQVEAVLAGLFATAPRSPEGRPLPDREVPA
jgi:dTMP kinase